MLSEAADGDFQAVKKAAVASSSTGAAVRCEHQGLFVLLGRSLLCNL